MGFFGDLLSSDYFETFFRGGSTPEVPGNIFLINNAKAVLNISSTAIGVINIIGTARAMAVQSQEAKTWQQL